jgi:CheY-like chemotaxis protein
MRDLLTTVLADAEVHGAKDGPSALRLLGAIEVDCVLLDVMMPGMTGFAVLERIRADPGLRHLPVAMLTAVRGETGHVAAFRDGADAYLTKPFDVEEVIAVVHGLCASEGEERERRRCADLERAQLLACVEETFGG